MSILSGERIAEAVDTRFIEIEPFNRDQLNPASYDLRLGNTFKRYKAGERGVSIDCAKKETMEARTDNFDHDVWLFPGTLYLMHTVERIHTDRFVPIVDGKSSVGRLGVFVHVTAGYGDPGFNGQYTLEVLVTYPTIVYAGMRIAQIRFHELSGGPPKLYDGSYTGEAAMGPQESRIWKQFQKS
jgi:dCTP deaminase